jgi:zinc transport system substrate-binding protein
MKRILITILVLSLTGCLSVKEDKAIVEKAKPMDVSASFYPLAYVSQRIGGKLVKITQITPGGVEPHDYEPTPQDLAVISNSKVFIKNGYGIDTWADNLAGVKAPGNSDPHFWLDPVLFQSEVEVVRDAFVQADPVNTAKYMLNAAGLLNDLKGLDQEFKNGLKECQGKKIITSHDAFGQLANRYGLENLSIAGVSPEEEPSPKRLAELSDLAKKNNIKYIFFETLVSPKLAETLANEIGAKTLVLNPVEGVTQEESLKGKDYLVLMQENLYNLRTALQCK